jgi:SAM-dependent MidA family methyltransferase
MADALYGSSGFYRGSSVPARHFRTSPVVSAAWAAAIERLARRVDDDLGRPEAFAVVDVGAGGGELLAALAATAPRRWSLVGVDLAPRPAELPARVAWSSTAPADVSGVIVANELLDVVPLDVVTLTADGPRLVEVSDVGAERPGRAPTADDRAWLARWWPLIAAGDRAEIGTTRDATWRDLTSRLSNGVAIAVDYAADPSRDRAGTLAGYRDGRRVSPVPDSSCDLTAHVRFESLVSEGDVVLSQREALRRCGVDGRRPAYGGDPSSYLTALASAGAAAELIDPAGLGSFTWLIHTRDCPLPLAAAPQPRASTPARPSAPSAARNAQKVQSVSGSSSDRPTARTAAAPSHVTPTAV